MVSCLAKYRFSMQVSLVALSLSVFVAGCGGGAAKGKGATARVKAAGKIEIDGKPVPAGTITFTSVTTGNTGSSEIKNGAYSMSSTDGPNPGDNSVIIVGKEKADGDALWQYQKAVKVANDGFKEDFAIKMAETQKPHVRVKDD